MIVGVGLIGGSVGLALRAEGWHVVGVDLDAGRLADAVDRNVIDEIGSLDTLPAADLGVVATPADSVAELAQRLLDAGVAAVTDVGSVKAAIAGAIEDPRFVAGHPMAGSEQDGLDGAAAHLFSGAMWVLCPTSTTDDTVFATRIYKNNNKQIPNQPDRFAPRATAK